MSLNDDHSRIFWSVDEARTKIEKYCAYQERCHKDVRTKLLEHGIYGDILEDILSDLIQNDFLNEERFASSFARGKFRIKKWGRVKIKQELKSRHVTEYCIRSAMTEIDEDEYMQTLTSLLTQKSRSVTFRDTWDKKKKLTDFALRKGFEYELIADALSSI